MPCPRNGHGGGIVLLAYELGNLSTSYIFVSVSCVSLKELVFFSGPQIPSSVNEKSSQMTSEVLYSLQIPYLGFMKGICGEVFKECICLVNLVTRLHMYKL